MCVGERVEFLSMSWICLWKGREKERERKVRYENYWKRELLLALLLVLKCLDCGLNKGKVKERERERNESSDVVHLVSTSFF